MTLFLTCLCTNPQQSLLLQLRRQPLVSHVRYTLNVQQATCTESHSVCMYVCIYGHISLCVCTDPWQSAKVHKNSRCSVELWSRNPILRIAAQAKCDSDPKCVGLHWLNNAGANRAPAYNGLLKFGSDGRSASEGWYQGCGGTIAAGSNHEWDVIVKPGKPKTAFVVCVCLCVCAHLSISLRICICMVMYVCVAMAMYVCVSVCLCLCTCI